jgi:FtsH-binding integral membrane protein
MRERAGALYSALVVAAIVVIVLSVIGIAIMSDLMPGMASPEEPVNKSARR